VPRPAQHEAGRQNGRGLRQQLFVFDTLFSDEALPNPLLQAPPVTRRARIIRDRIAVIVPGVVRLDPAQAHVWLHPPKATGTN
jgi:hypothetical protein